MSKSKYDKAAPSRDILAVLELANAVLEAVQPWWYNGLLGTF